MVLYTIYLCISASFLNAMEHEPITKKRRLATSQSLLAAPRKPDLMHKRSYTCTYQGCGQVFSRSNNLKNHLQTHISEKPYICDYFGCNKAFTRIDTLKAHAYTHTGEKPYKCHHSNCDKTFTQLSSLNYHLSTKHVDAQPKSSTYPIKQHNKSYPCDFCDKIFNQKSNLTVHLRTHTGEQPYKCDYPECGKKFSQLSNLKRHAGIHNKIQSSTEKPSIGHADVQYYDIAHPDMSHSIPLSQPLVEKLDDQNESSRFVDSIFKHE